MGAPLILLDTNVLLRWVHRKSAEHELVHLATSSLVKSGYTLCYTSQNIGELWNVLTPPINKNGFGDTVIEAASRADEI